MQVREERGCNAIAKFAYKESFHHIIGSLRGEVYPHAVSDAQQQSCGCDEAVDV